MSTVTKIEAKRQARLADDFECYFGVADELWPDEGVSPAYSYKAEAEFTMTLDDLDKQFVKRAKRAAEALGLSWPPYLPEAEEFALDLRNGRRSFESE